MLNVNGGYDEGYKAVPCLWGTAPGSLVRAFLDTHDARGLHVLDVGAGEGKNAAAFARRGANVDALECSSAAIKNGKVAFRDARMNWIEADAETFAFPAGCYDVVISYGLTHCMRSEAAAERVVACTKAAAKLGGVYMLVSFNDGSHDLSAHPGFEPLLMSHAWFLDAFADWNILSATDSIRHETHPHNQIPHHHSLTHLVARRQ